MGLPTDRTARRWPGLTRQRRRTAGPPRSVFSWQFGRVAGLVLMISIGTVIPVAAQTRAIRFGHLIDGTGRVMDDAVVVIERDRITRVGSGDSAIPAGAAVIDLRRYTGLPGLIDVHTHMTYYWDRKPGTSPWRQGGTRTPEQTAGMAAENALRTLEAGVTTVRDLGASNHTDILMRDRIASGAMVGPRMIVAAYGLQKARPQAGNAPANPNATNPVLRGRVSDVSQVAAAVQAQVDAGADVIKMYGSTGSGADVTGNETFTFEEMRAAVEAAHRLGRRIAIHSYGPDGGRDAVRAGAESVEHAIDLDDATLAEMARRGTVYVPTIDHNRYYAEYRADFDYTDEQAIALDAFRERNLETTRRAFKAGVTIAMGSDAVFHMFGQNTRELRWFIAAGMTPAQALQTATANAAALLGMETDIGQVTAGHYADIIAVDGDPLTDIDALLYRVRWVMKGGDVVVDLVH
jgi:imidazolonepropionase-like amidohydrolase